MKALVRLYPRSWRKRYGAEMEALVEDAGGRLGVGLDLVVGAAVAYRDVIAGNRILAAAGACLHGMCVAVLVQAIGFVALILLEQRGANPTQVSFGPFDFVMVVRNDYFQFGGRELQATILPLIHADWLPEAVLLAVLLGALAIVLALPRLVRRLA